MTQNRSNSEKTIGLQEAAGDGLNQSKDYIYGCSNNPGLGHRWIVHQNKKRMFFN